MTSRRALRLRSDRSRTALLAVGTVLAGLVLSACGAGDGTDASGGSSGGSGTRFVPGTGCIDKVAEADRKPLPDLSGPTVDGKEIDLADYKGKVVVINVWGSWCTPCRAEMPHLVKIANETEADGVRFVGINSRDPNKAPAVKFEKEFGVPYPSLYDPTGRLMLRFPKGSLNPRAIPSTVFVDRDGRIAARALKPLGEEELRKTLDPLIAEK